MFIHGTLHGYIESCFRLKYNINWKHRVATRIRSEFKVAVSLIGIIVKMRDALCAIITRVFAAATDEINLRRLR